MLNDWLNHIQKLHPAEIDLSLERIKKVATRLQLLKPHYPIITVGGTNGKGSTVAALETIYQQAGYRVGTFTTPFLFHFTDQFRIQGKELEETAILQAFEIIEKAREIITLTLFEFKTLAALILFQDAKIDVGILEVGLGGQFDAVNIIDADVAVITSIGLDHVDRLGNTREAIAAAKAGIFRLDKPAVCGDFYPPHTLLGKSKQFYCQGKEFGFLEKENNWSWYSATQKFDELPIAKLALQNISTALMAVELMQYTLPVSFSALCKGIESASLPGRIQVMEGKVTHIFDVSHNPDSAEFLAKYLRKNPVRGKTHAVFSMLADKDIISTLLAIKDNVDHWYIGTIPDERGASLNVLDYCFRKTNIQQKKSYSGLKKAYEAAHHQAQPCDQIIVFGSFRTVAEVFKAAANLNARA